MKKQNSLKWLIKNSSSQRLNMVLLILANAFFSLLTVAFAYVIKIVIDGATGGNQDYFLYGAIAIVSIIVLQFVFRILINGLLEHICGKLEIVYKSKLFADILNKKYKKITKYHSGDLMNRLTADVSVVADGMSTILPTVVASVVRLIGAVVLLCVIDWVFAIALIVAGLLVFFVIGILRGKLKSLHKKTQETDGKTRSFMQESIENLLAIKVFSVQDKTNVLATDMQNKNFKVKMKRRNYSILGNSTYNFIFSAGYIFALIYGGVKLLSGDTLFGYGDLSAILQLVNSVQVPFASLSSVMPKYYAMVASAERLMEIQDIENDEPVVNVDVGAVYDKINNLTIKGLTFSYDGKELIYDKADLVLQKGQSVAIVGASGIGKSTIMKLLLGVYPINDGELYFDCGDNKMPVCESTRSLFSYVPQGNMLFSGSIKDNITLVRSDATEEEIDYALRISCADEFVYALPNKLDTLVGENGLGLSEGQVQRLALARAVICKAPIMLLDEATGSLDEQTEKKVIENLLSIPNTTVIIISHRQTAINMCQKVVNVVNKKFN